MSDLAATDVMLAEMGACAFRLGTAFGRAAEAEADHRRMVEIYQLFDRCFFSVRVATALRLRREGAPAGASATARPSRLETERPETENLADPPETELPETDGSEDGRAPRERLDADREREAERATLPSLIETLRGVAADAAHLPASQKAHLAADLPALDALLARLPGAPPKPQIGAQATPSGPAPPGLRARLAAGSGAAVAVLARPPDPRRSPLFPRPPTGPPFR